MAHGLWFPLSVDKGLIEGVSGSHRTAQVQCGRAMRHVVAWDAALRTLAIAVQHHELVIGREARTVR